MRLTPLIGLIAMATTGAGASNATATDLSDDALLRALWETPADSETLFGRSFLESVPFRRVESILTDLKQDCGAFETVVADSTDHHYTIRTARCGVPIRLHRDADGRISGLLFQPPIRLDATLDDVLAEIRMFDGAVSYAIYENGARVAGHAADRPLAVGSTFKLIVLAELRAMIEAGDARWADVVTLQPQHLSLPSGRLQNMPVGSPMTLHTLAAAMIAESDNTATDLLIDVVGRDRLERSSGLVPFLTTREMFQLKADGALYDRYAAAGPATRRTILADLRDAPLPPPERASGPWLEEAEWFLSTASLCAWMNRVADLDIAQINPGVVPAADWRTVAYKGGSQDGVLNLTTQASDDQGRTACVSMTWNADHAIDTDRLALLYGSAFAALRGR